MRCALAVLVVALAVCGCGSERPHARPVASEAPGGVLPATARATTGGEIATAAASVPTRIEPALAPEVLARAPVVVIDVASLRVGAAVVGDVRALAAQGEPAKIDGLDGVLRALRAQAMMTDPDRPFDGVVVLDVEDAVPAVVVKSAVQTAAHAGYPHVSLVVRQRAVTSPSGAAGR